MVTEVIWIAKGGCKSLKPIKLLVTTEDVTLAVDKSLVRLKEKTEHWERYCPICAYREMIEV